MLGVFITIPRLHQAFHSNHGCIRLCDRRYGRSQGMIGKDLPIVYTFRLLNKAEQNYSIEKELLAIVCSVQFFRSYIYGRKFTLVTDQ